MDHLVALTPLQQHKLTAFKLRFEAAPGSFPHAAAEIDHRESFMIPNRPLSDLRFLFLGGLMGGPNALI